MGLFIVMKKILDIWERFEPAVIKLGAGMGILSILIQSIRILPTLPILGQLGFFVLSILLVPLLYRGGGLIGMEFGNLIFEFLNKSKKGDQK